MLNVLAWLLHTNVAFSPGLLLVCMFAYMYLKWPCSSLFMHECANISCFLWFYLLVSFVFVNLEHSHISVVAMSS